eukprot:m.428533 g.428533  ORF g.428533 m.428533 type:complete len:341 (-) comp16870_c0_seq7:3026-4048(-)
MKKRSSQQKRQQQVHLQKYKEQTTCHGTTTGSGRSECALAWDVARAEVGAPLGDCGEHALDRRGLVLGVHRPHHVPSVHVVPECLARLSRLLRLPPQHLAPVRLVIERVSVVDWNHRDPAILRRGCLGAAVPRLEVAGREHSQHHRRLGHPRLHLGHRRRNQSGAWLKHLKPPPPQRRHQQFERAVRLSCHVRHKHPRPAAVRLEQPGKPGVHPLRRHHPGCSSIGSVGLSPPFNMPPHRVVGDDCGGKEDVKALARRHQPPQRLDAATLVPSRTADAHVHVLEVAIQLHNPFHGHLARVCQDTCGQPSLPHSESGLLAQSVLQSGEQRGWDHQLALADG